jgi:hypothetical protein
MDYKFSKTKYITKIREHVPNKMWRITIVPDDDDTYDFWKRGLFAHITKESNRKYAVTIRKKSGELFTNLGIFNKLIDCVDEIIGYADSHYSIELIVSPRK